jgi:hypothetical protein
MRIMVFMIDITAITFMNPTLLFKVATRFITRRSPLLLLFSTVVFLIFFIVVSAHSAH